MASFPREPARELGRSATQLQELYDWLACALLLSWQGLSRFPKGGCHDRRCKMCSRVLTRSALLLSLTATAIFLTAVAAGQEKGKKSHTDGVIVLIDAKTEGIAEGAKIKQIEIL